MDDVVIIFTPWPFDADGNDLSRVSLSHEDAKALLELAYDIADKAPAEETATEHLAWALWRLS
jgi:hypothetical protein